MMYDGNLAALEARDRAEDRWLEARPVCTACKEPIQELDCYNTPRGLMCEECAWSYAYDLAEEFRRDTLDDWRDSTDRYIE